MLRLPTIRDQFAEAADKAEREQLTYRGFLAELLMAECEDRDRRRAERQVRGAGFPRAKWLADFDFDANPGISPAVINTLATCRTWVPRKRPAALPDRRLQSWLTLRISFIGVVEQSMCGVVTWIRNPFRRPWVTRTALSSLRWTLCNTVSRAIPALMRPEPETQPSGASGRDGEQVLSTRIRQGAAGVSCSPVMKPSRSHR